MAHAVIGAAIDVHRALGPGFLESMYEEALCIELESRGIPFARQVAVVAMYRGRSIGHGKLDLLVGDVSLSNSRLLTRSHLCMSHRHWHISA